MLMWISEIKICKDLNVNIRQYNVLDINGYECLYLWISILDIHRYAHVNIWDHYTDRYDVNICEYLWIQLTNIWTNVCSNTWVRYKQGFKLAWISVFEILRYSHEHICEYLQKHMNRYEHVRTLMIMILPVNTAKELQLYDDT